jgi:hypothetical protein
VKPKAMGQKPMKILAVFFSLEITKEGGYENWGMLELLCGGNLMLGKVLSSDTHKNLSECYMVGS